MDSACEALNAQLRSYSRREESDSRWLDLHHDVMAFYMIREKVQLGLTIYDALIRRGMRDGITVQEAIAVCSLYEQWHTESTHWINCAAASKRHGHEVALLLGRERAARGAQRP